MPHWDALRAAIADRGLSALVADSGEKATSKLASELTGGPSMDNYDPLMGAHNAIVSNAMGFVGIALMAPNEDGTERCPLCFLTQSHAEGCSDASCTITTYDDWIDKAADEQVEVWKGLHA